MTGQLGGNRGVPPLELAASSVIRDVQRVVTHPAMPATPVTPLDKEQRHEAYDIVKKGLSCVFCAGIHAGASTPACPRLASGKVNGDGTVVEFTFWRHGQWDTSRVIFVADLEDEPPDDETEET